MPTASMLARDHPPSAPGKQGQINTYRCSNWPRTLGSEDSTVDSSTRAAPTQPSEPEPLHGLTSLRPSGALRVRGLTSACEEASRDVLGVRNPSKAGAVSPQRPCI